jgi:predicted NBD/HSP70 family sugar kinase
METLWGIDLGGTKIEGVVMPLDSDEPLFRMRIDTESDQGYEHIVRRIGILINQIEETSGLKRPSRIGVGTPGAAEPATGLMKNCNTTCLNGRPLPADMEAELGSAVVVANDANCLALAEATLGAGKGAETVFGVIMGTGVGGGLVVHGRVLNGAQGIAGEWGHNVLIPGGEQCYCGKQGCVELVLSGTGLQRFYRSQSGEQLTLKEIVQRTNSDPHARATIDRLIDYFGQAISVVINIFDPDMIVLGGGVGNIAALYTDGAKSAEKWVFNTMMRTRIVPPLLGDSAGVFGAAMLVRR